MHLKVPENLGNFLSMWLRTCLPFSFELVWDANVIPQWQEKQPLVDPQIRMNAYCGFVCVCMRKCTCAVCQYMSLAELFSMSDLVLVGSHWIYGVNFTLSTFFLVYISLLYQISKKGLLQKKTTSFEIYLYMVNILQNNKKK